MKRREEQRRKESGNAARLRKEERKLEKEVQREREREKERERETVRDAGTRRPGELPPPLRKPLKNKQTKKTCPPLSDLRRSPPPPFAFSRAQEFLALPPKPLKVLPKPEEDKKFFEQWRF